MDGQVAVPAQGDQVLLRIIPGLTAKFLVVNLQVLEAPAGLTSPSIPSQGFSVYNGQIPFIEQAIEAAAIMLRNDKSRGYCLETIGADFLAVAIWKVAILKYCCNRSRSSSRSQPESSGRHSSHKHIRRRHRSSSTEAQLSLRLDSELYERFCRTATC
jgi:hypothetical protein